ncbi:sulfotransferase [Actinomadura sp. KC216]|uniref:sulfotransferase n=1 Tax=Actinomadura sp. KC216 TaxID=2530370 RepID=UPI001042FBF0|nr:sulfotransferase [Actinomadura sp. KC216]TDB79925.1 sulfotransferase [Actinomadura sp. KC216]
MIVTGLEYYREGIDALDETIVRALARRVAICRDVAEFKARTKTPMMQPQRVGVVKHRAADLGERYGLDRAFVERLYDLVVEMTCRTEDVLIESLASAPPAPPPVFIGGENRSGTTLVSLMLDSHPGMVVGPELDFTDPEDLGPHLLECCRLLLADDPRVRGHGVRTADPAYEAGVQFARQAQRCGVPIAALCGLVETAMRRSGSDLHTYDQRLALLDAIGRTRLAATGKRRWGIKIQREIAHADRFVRRWPGARFVHVVRDGRDVAASQRSQPWGYRSIGDAAAGWAGLVNAVRDVVPRKDCYELRYEDLVADPEAVLRPLCAFLDEPWDARVLRHADSDHALSANPFEHPSAEAARRPVNDASVGRYRRELSERDIEDFERIAGDALQRLGYPTAVRA